MAYGWTRKSSYYNYFTKIHVELVKNRNHRRITNFLSQNGAPFPSASYFLVIQKNRDKFLGTPTTIAVVKHDWRHTFQSRNSYTT